MDRIDHTLSFRHSNPLRGKNVGKQNVSVPYQSQESEEKAITRWGKVAGWMDNAFRIPGTSVRFGIDPILGLIPFVGDMIAGVISSSILVVAHKHNIPKIVQLRMALNIFLNAVIGVIPGFGDLFSIWFKSNVKNYELLQRHRAHVLPSTTRSSWLFVGGVLFFSMMLIGVFFTLMFLAMYKLLHG